MQTCGDQYEQCGSTPPSDNNGTTGGGNDNGGNDSGGDDGDDKCEVNDVNCQLNNNDDYLLGVGVDLSPDETQDLLTEINWWLDWIINPLDDFGDYILTPLEIIGIASIIALVVAPAAPLAVIGIVVGAVAWGIDQFIGNTKDDLQDLRYELAMESKGGNQGVKLEMGVNIGSWGVEVNDSEAINHYDVGVFTPKSLFSATKVWLAGWYLFDYGK